MKKFTQKIKRVGLIANAEKFSCGAAVQKAATLIKNRGGSIVTDSLTAQLAGFSMTDCPTAGAVAKRCDLILVFGGDGTMLRVAREVAGLRTPILGINVGGLGFLTAVPFSELPKALTQITRGDFRLESRPLIEAGGRLGQETIIQRALNDFVFSRGAASRMIELEVSVDDQALTRYRCDGLIVSSPTGSTAYSLAAGGAVISPTADVFALTPICPHTLSNRSVIVNLRSTIKVKVLSEKLETFLTADGQVQTPLNAGDEVTIYRSRRALRLMHLGGGSFFQTLRQKLHWSGSNV